MSVAPPPPAALADIEAIRQLKARYFRLLDQKRWAEWREVFTDDVHIETPDDVGPDFSIDGAQNYVDFLQPMIDHVPTVHHGHMAEISVDGDTASGVWSMEDHLFWPPEAGLGHMWGTGWYTETYRRVEGQWRIATLLLTRIRVLANTGTANQTVLFPRG